MSKELEMRPLPKGYKEMKKKLRDAKKELRSEVKLDNGDDNLMSIPEGTVRLAIAENDKGNPKILNDIMAKIQEVVDAMNSEKITEAKLPYLGSTLKSLVQAYHFINLTLGISNFVTSPEMEDIPDDPDEIIEKTAEISLKVKRKWDKGK
jgi:N-acetylglucosamine kinase-like BadF-type ATPase